MYSITSETFITHLQRRHLKLSTCCSATDSYTDRELDKLIVDLKLKDEVQAAKRKPKKKKARRRRTKAPKDDTNTARTVDEEEEEQNGFHFVAYVPVESRVWKMDGLDRQPQLLGL